MNALADMSKNIKAWRGQVADLYYCPHCGYMITHRVARKDMIDYCWGRCLNLYNEALPLTFVRGLGAGRPQKISVSF